MGRRCKSYLLVPVILLGLILAFAMPAAAWTKLYRCPNTTGVSQTSVRTITNGLESIVSQYAVPTVWAPGKVGAAVLSGTYNTTITYGATAVGAGTNVTIGWQTGDNSCRLRDLRWGRGQVVVPTQLGGVPGGGVAVYDYPNPGDLTVLITNDNLVDPESPGQWITLSDVEFAVFPAAANWDELYRLLVDGFLGGSAASGLSTQALSGQASGEVTGGSATSGLSAPAPTLLSSGGLAGGSATDVAQAIGVLRGEVVYQRDHGGVPRSNASGLLSELDAATALNLKALRAYQAGQQSTSHGTWNAAASKMTEFIDSVTALKKRRAISQGLYDRWIVNGDGQIATAPQIKSVLLALSQGRQLPLAQPLSSLPPPPATMPLPEVPGLDPGGYQVWPVNVLVPGEYTAIVIPNVPEGAGLVMRGSVLDAAGTHVLDWIEQATAEPWPLDTEPPVITGASITPELSPVDGSLVAMTLAVSVYDNVGTDWYVSGVTSNEPDSGDDWMIGPDDAQALQLRAETTGIGFSRPVSVSVNPGDDSVWMADWANNQVVHLGADGTEISRTSDFTVPISVSVDPGDGSCWVADLYSDKVVHLAADGVERTQTGGFSGPVSVSVNPNDGSCWVADEFANRVVQLGEDGVEVASYDGFYQPVSVSFNPNDGSCWVADSGSNQVVHLSAAGVPVSYDGFNFPVSVSVDPSDGSCWVADADNNQVVHLSAAGVPVSYGGFALPYSVSVDPTDSSCWVADRSNQEVVHLSATGSELWRGGGFSSPLSVSANPADGSCWVADIGDRQVVHLDGSGRQLWRGFGTRTYTVSLRAIDMAGNLSAPYQLVVPVKPLYLPVGLVSAYNGYNTDVLLRTYYEAPLVTYGGVPFLVKPPTSPPSCNVIATPVSETMVVDLPVPQTRATGMYFLGIGTCLADYLGHQYLWCDDPNHVWFGVRYQDGSSENIFPVDVQTGLAQWSDILWGEGAVVRFEASPDGYVHMYRIPLQNKPLAGIALYDNCSPDPSGWPPGQYTILAVTMELAVE